MFIEQDVFTSFEFWSFDSNKNFNKSYFYFGMGVKVLQLYCFILICFIVLMTGSC